MRRAGIIGVLALSARLWAETKAGAPLGSAAVIAFVGVTDAARAKAFYADILGLRFVNEEPSHALVFDANGTMLRVSIVPQVAPARYTVLGWRVTDIAATIEALAGKGVRFERFPSFGQDERGIWTAPDGTRVAWFKDPDGNVLSVTQFTAEPGAKKR
jgi:catechol 2,3-dioxygenase-like lactoylglutathione lyase family enzyme